MAYIPLHDDEGDDESPKPTAFALRSSAKIKISDVKKHYIKFSYEVSLLRACKYSLNHSSLDKHHFEQYFKQAQFYSKKTINDFLELEHRDYHTCIQALSSCGKTLKDFYKSNVAGFNYTDPADQPLVGQFALYPKNTQSPYRVNFILAPMGLFYVVGIDTTHSLRPTG